MNSESDQKSWYNRPLWGEQSFVEWIKSVFSMSRFKKEEIPSATINIYKSHYGQIKNTSALIKTINDIKFTSREFVDFLMLNRQLESQTGIFEGLKNSVDLLRVALDTKDSFLKIEATELSFRSFSQQEFYEHIFKLLEQDLSSADFREKAQRQLSDTLPKIKSDRGKVAIQSYVNQLDIVSEDKLGLKLLYFFKQNDLTSFSVLRTVADVADSFYDKNLDSLKEFRVAVQLQADVFLKLGQIIQVPYEKNTPETYAIILQYIALRNRHGKSYSQFQQLLNLLRAWRLDYDPLITILQEYPPEEYQQPDIFNQDIPAIDIYNKYETYL